MHQLKTQRRQTSKPFTIRYVQAIIEDVPAHEMLMVVGYLHARPGNNNFKGKSGFGLSSEHLEIQKHQPENQDLILQEQCLKHSIVWCRIVEDDQDHQSQTRSLPEQVSVKYSLHSLADHHLKLRAAQNN